MTSEGVEIDLYADEIGDEFSQENEYNDTDLYDDVITSHHKSLGRSTSSSQAEVKSDQAESAASYNGNSSQISVTSHNTNSYSQHHGNASASINSDTSLQSYSGGRERSGTDKKPSIYVGNLTWWTTDEDVVRALNNGGINDVIEVKFFENRANGQSKGFCVVTLSSDQSVRMAIEKLAKTELHGQTIAVTVCTRQNLNNFEMKSRKTTQNGQPDRPIGNNSMSGGGGGGGGSGSGNRGNDNRSGGGGGGGGGGGMLNNNFNHNSSNMMGGGGRPPLIQRPLRPNGPLLQAQPRIPQMSHQPMPFGSSNAQQWQQLMPNGPRASLTGAPAMTPLLRMPGGAGGRPLGGNQPLLGPPSNQADLRNQLSQVPSLSAVTGQHPGLGGPHLNPLFSSQQSLNQLNHGGPGDQFGGRGGYGMSHPYGSGHSANDYGRPPIDLALQMSEAEFEELLNKNKNLANNAMTRAVSDAAAGDYSAAVDTLVTAISLISQSRVAHDDRCKLVVASLRDTLQSIESKSYSMGGDRSDRREKRPRSRERSRERISSSSRREKQSSSRHRTSHSRERDSYRERSRDRYHEERYHEDRYREKDRDRERDRDRDRRSSRH